MFTSLFSLFYVTGEFKGSYTEPEPFTGPDHPRGNRMEIPQYMGVLKVFLLFFHSRTAYC